MYPQRNWNYIHHLEQGWKVLQDQQNQVVLEEGRYPVYVLEYCNTDINNEAVYASLLEHKNQMSNEDYDNVCHILKNMCLK